MFGLTKDDASANAIELLKSDHREVERLFKQYEEIKEGAENAAKEELVAQICDGLTVHSQIEETIFYPAARQALPHQEGQDLLNEAAVEHQTLKDIIGRLEIAPTSDPLYDAGVKVLSEYVKHHVREEESELFPKVRSSGMDLEAIGKQLAQRKQQLEGQMSRTSSNGSHGRRNSRSRGEIARHARPEDSRDNVARSRSSANS